MKQYIKLFAIFAVIAFLFACTNQEALKPVSPIEVKTQIYKGIGIIKNIDEVSGKITIDHEDIPGYMSAMEMTESVRDKAMLETVKVGDKIDFEIERQGSDIIITKLKKIGEDETVKAFAIYKTNCAECHGASGEGVDGKGIPLISGHALHHSEAEHIKQVTDGEGKKMPAFRDKLTANEIKSVVNFVRQDLQKNTKRDESSKHQH